MNPAPAAGRVTASGAIIGTDGLVRPPWAASDPLLRAYYDCEWGLPVHSEDGLFERLSLEAFQAGLSWATILRKRPAFREAFAAFQPERVAAFTETYANELMQNPGIVRNRQKIQATIRNAQATLELRQQGGLDALIWSFKPERTPAPQTLAEIPTSSPEATALAAALRARGFSFVGPKTMFALMEAIGMVDTHLVDSHRRGSAGVWT